MSHRKNWSLAAIATVSTSIALFTVYAVSCTEAPTPEDNPNAGCDPLVAKNCLCDNAASCGEPTGCTEEWTCVAVAADRPDEKVCKRNVKSEGSPIKEQVAGDCKKIVCTADGNPLPETDLDDKPPAAGTCQRGTCSDAGEPEQAKVPEGELCENGASGVCTGAGSCVSCIAVTNAGCPQGEVCYEMGVAPAVMLACTHCADGMQNGDETDLDCGGHCPMTHKCGPGQGCKLASDCGASSSGCGAEVCCNSAACTDLCKGCQIGSGTCVALPPGAPDTKCPSGQICNGTGNCATLRHTGEPCVGAGDCISGTCEGSSKTCAKSTAGTACIDTSDCVAPATCDKYTHKCG